MATFHDLTTTQLRQAVQIREQISSLQEKLDALLGGSSNPTKGKRIVSAATKKKMAAAQQARWAHVRSPADEPVAKKATAAKAPIPMVAKKKGGLTAAGRVKLAAAMKARWAARKKGAPAPNAPAN